MIENTMNMICKIRVRVAFRFSAGFAGFLLDFLFLISYLMLT
jgi:hypothetical protein